MKQTLAGIRSRPVPASAVGGKLPSVESEHRMTTLIEELSQKARALSAEDRARLAEDLLASLEDGSEPPSEVETAWEREIRRRVEDVKNGTAKLIPAEDVYAETRRIYQKK